MRKISKRGYLTMASIVVLVGLIYCYYQRTHMNIIHNGKIDLEVGESLTFEAVEYLDLLFYLPFEKNQISKEAKVHFENMEYLNEEKQSPAIGQYQASVVYRDKTYPFVLNVQDTQAPVITCEKEIAYQDTTFEVNKWIQVTDNSQESCQVKVIHSDVDTQKIGKYTIEVEAIDSSQNKAHEILEVQVVDKTAPDITYSNELVLLGETFDPLKNVKAIDNLDGDCTSLLKVNGNVNTQKAGIYPLTYEVVDQTGNKAEVERRVVVANKEHKINGIPMILQNPGYYNGCESASSTMLLQYHGFDISMKSMVNQVPTIALENKNGRLYGADPQVAFTGSMSREGYGIYCQPMVSVIEKIVKKQNGQQKVVNLTGSSVDELLAYVAMDCPVQVWATASMTDAKYSSIKKWYVKTLDGEYTDKVISFPVAEHSLLLVGYNENYVFMHDPLQGVRQYSRKAFEKAYQSMGSQALTIIK